MGARHSGPRAHSQHVRRNVAQTDKTLQGGIDPTIQGHVWRSHIVWVADLLSVFFLEGATPPRAAEFGIVVSAINLPPEIPAEGAAGEGVGWEVLFRGDSSYGHGRSQT